MKVQHTFKLPPKISADAEAYWNKAGITQTQFFTEAVIEKLSGHSEEASLQELQRTQEEIAAMRLEMAHLARALLTQSGEDKDPMTRERVMEWLEVNMEGRGVRS